MAEVRTCGGGPLALLVVTILKGLKLLTGYLADSNTFP